MKWTTTVIQDRWAYASCFRGGQLYFKYVELKDYPYHRDAMKAAIDDVIKQMGF